MELKPYLEERKAIIDRALDSYMPMPEGPTSDVIKAMRHSLFAGGKRLRPILCMGGAEAVAGDYRDVIPVACSLEMIHTYSLIHDDLPAMDDDDLRRGKPTCHKLFGEAVAILAGDALLTEAFHLMAGPEQMERVSPGMLIRVVPMIARAAGWEGMVGGQVVDIQSEGKEVDLSTVEFIHHQKTASLITVSVASGAMLAGADHSGLEAVTSYGKNIGLAFQIYDDILDLEGDAAVLGKSTGADAEKGKATYPGVVGLQAARERLYKLVEGALEDLKNFDAAADPLRKIARYIIEREK